MQENESNLPLPETENSTVTGLRKLQEVKIRQWCYMQCIHSICSMEDKIIEARKLEMYLLGKDSGTNPNTAITSIKQ